MARQPTNAHAAQRVDWTRRRPKQVCGRVYAAGVCVCVQQSVDSVGRFFCKIQRAPVQARIISLNCCRVYLCGAATKDRLPK